MAVEILLRFTAMGDLLLAVPAARALAARGSQVEWVIHRRWSQLAPFLPARVHVWGKIGDLFPLARRLRALQPDRVHDLQGKIASIFLSTIIGTTVTRYRKRDCIENIRSAFGKYPLSGGEPRPVWQRYLETVGTPGAAPDGGLVFPSNRLLEAQNWLRTERGLEPYSYVLFHPGASQIGKILPKAAGKAFLDALHNPVVIGDCPEPALTGNFVDFRGRLPLNRLPDLMMLSNGLISSDSGPMHLGRAVGIPVVGVFIQTDPVLGFSPIPSPRTKVFSRTLPCKPCSLHGQRAVCPVGNWACRDLPWPSIAREVSGFLENAA